MTPKKNFVGERFQNVILAGLHELESGSLEQCVDVFQPKGNLVPMLPPTISTLHQNSLCTKAKEFKVGWSWPPSALSFSLREMRPNQTQGRFQGFYSSINSLLYE